MSKAVVDPAIGEPRPGGAAPGGTGAGGASEVRPPAALSEAAAKAFAREIAKYPPEGKASAVIACLTVLQREHGWISQESETLVAAALDMPPIAVHEVTTFYNMFNQAPVGRVKINVCTNLPCQLRGGQLALEHLCSSLHIDEGGTTSDGAFTVQKAECLGACADAPVLLVNDVQMVSFMSDTRLDDLLQTLRNRQRGEPGMTTLRPDLSRFQATGTETCFHGRHIGAQIYAGLDGSNWRLKEYEARGGYNAWKKILELGEGKGMTPDQVIAEVKASGLRGRGGAGFPDRPEVELHAASVSRVQKYLVCNSDEGEPGTCKDRDILMFNPHSVIEGMTIAAYAMGIRRSATTTSTARSSRSTTASKRRSRKRARPACVGDNIARQRLRASSCTPAHGFGAYICGEETASARIAGRQERAATLQAAVPGELRPLRQAHHDQQHRDLRRGALDHHAMAARSFSKWASRTTAAPRSIRSSGDVQKLPGNYEVPLGTPFPKLLELAGGVPQGPHAQGRHPWRLIGAGADRQGR